MCKRIKKFLIVFMVITITIFSSIFSVSAVESDYIYQFPMNKPEVTDNSGYVELLMYDGSNYIPSTLYFSFTTSSELGVTDISEINFVVNVSGNVVSVYSNTSIDGFLYLYLLRENGNCFVYRKVAPIGTNDITLHLNQVVGYHCYGAEFNSDIINVTNFTFVYGEDSVNYSSFNDILDYLYRLLDNSNISKDKLDSILNSATSINTKCDDVIRYLYDISSKLDISNSRLDTIISILEQNKNDIINNQSQNTDKIIQNQEENQSEITNGWQQNESIDTSTTDDYAAKDKELQGATEQGRSQAVSIFNSFGSLFQSDGHLYKGLLSVSAIFTEFFKIDWVSSLINFSLALGVFAFVIGTGSAVFKSAHEKNEKSKVDKIDSYDERWLM